MFIFHEYRANIQLFVEQSVECLDESQYLMNCERANGNGNEIAAQKMISKLNKQS